MDLFGRKWSLSIGSLDLTDLDIAFKTERHIHRSPNTAEIRIWNLAPETRAQIEGGARPFTPLGAARVEVPDGIVRLALGYGEDDPAQVFRGDVRVAWTEWTTNVDAVTTIQARDGGRAHSESRISRAYPAGTSIATVVRDTVRSMDIGEGNLAEFAAAYSLRTGASTFPDGYAAHGRSHRILTDLLRGGGLRWSVQAGALQIQRQGEPLQTRAVLLNSSTGLVDSPAWDERGRRSSGRRGLLTARALIMPGLDPGRRVRVEADAAEGDFEIRSVSLLGDTRGNDWYADLELRPIA